MPGTRCAVFRCNNTYKKRKESSENFVFHRFPRAKDLVSQTIRQEWIVRCKKDKLNPDTSYICSVHFTENDYERDLQNELMGLPLKKCLKKTAVPTLVLYNKNPSGEVSWCSVLDKEQILPSTKGLSAGETNMYFIKEIQTELNFSQEKHPFTAESKTIKSQLDDFHNRKTANEVDRDLDQKSTIKKYSHIKTEEENEKTCTEVKFSLKDHPFTTESVSVKTEQDDFDNRDTANEVDRELDQKSTIKSEEENVQYLVSHEEVNIKSEDDVEQSDNWQGQFETFKCAHCTYETPRKSNLKQHLLVHLREDIPWVHCPEPKCPYKTYEKSKLKLHSRVHSDDRFFKCPQCPYQAKHMINLKRHQLKHESTDKWYACSHCPYKSIRKCNLKEHVVRRHANPDQLELYMCEQCPYKSYRKNNFKKHAFTHNMDLSKLLHHTRHPEYDAPGWHKCPECPYKTIRKHHLQGHAKNHEAADQTDWLQCPECSYRTPRPQHLKVHQMLHTAEVKWFRCLSCPYKTNWKHSLASHVKMHQQTG